MVLKNQLALQLANTMKKPFCINCKHFLPNSYIKNDSFGFCSLFTVKYIAGQNFTGENIKKDEMFTYTFMPCSLARSDAQLCGKSGKFYKEK